MKKTLFAMAALALCGTAFAENMYVLANGDYDLYDGDTLHVNDTASVNYIYVDMEAAPVTLKFYGLNTITGSEGLYLYSSGPSINIVGDEAAINHWVSELTSATGELKSVTLMTFDAGGVEMDMESDPDFTFDGNEGGETITLGNVSVQYMGYGDVPSFDLFDSVLGENQIALAKNGNSLALVGKISGSPATPEPATATLSLLALAGMASRRRRK